MTILPVYGVSTALIVSLIILLVLVGVMIGLSIWGKKLQTKQQESQQQMEAAAQNVSLLIIDKRRMKLKEAGLPSIVVEQTPKRFRGQKVPIVKAKVGPRVMSLICEEKVFEQIPVKKEVKARVSGIYILSVKGVRGNLEQPSDQKPSLRQRLLNKLSKTQNELKEETERQEKEKAQKKAKKKK